MRIGAATQPFTTAGTAPAPPSVLRELTRHRQCAPEHAPIVRRLCLSDRSVLPRRHQADRRTTTRRARGLHVSAPAGAYAKILAWKGRQHWLTFVIPVAIAVHREILRAHEVSPAMFRAWAGVKSGYVQDQATGRRCVVRPDTVASVMGVRERTVQRCNAAARAMGLEVVVMEGRMLTWAERKPLVKAWSRQRGLSTESALTIPQSLPRALWTVTPPIEGAAPGNTPHDLSTLHAASGDQMDAASPQHRHKRVRKRGPGYKLALDVCRTIPWLHQESPWRISGTLSKLAQAALAWTGQDVADHLEYRSARLGLSPWIDPATVREPYALLAKMLRDVDEYADHPRLQDLSPTPTTASRACGHDDCDGYGWIHHADGRLTPCTDCPPEIREHLVIDVTGTGPIAEPPF